VKARFYIGGNPMKKAIQGSFTHTAFGHLVQFSHLSIDTACFFPRTQSEFVGDYGVRTKSFPATSLVFSGRKPTDAESKKLASLFPKATIEHRERPEPAPDVSKKKHRPSRLG
jgi:hypothetical protein